jgi:CubicO group peptidase (beta-lactamase class C family)
MHPFKENEKHKMWSVTKSITSTLIGIAIKEGFIKGVNHEVIDLFPSRKIQNLDENKKSMTLKDVLTMTSGLGCNDGWEINWVGVREMMKSDDWTEYALNLPMEYAPGERFEYCNCNSHILSAIIKEATGINTVDFANKYLFGPLGIDNSKWDISPEGLVIGFSGLWLEPKEMAKIGLLYL